MERELKQWSERILTPFGRKTILKALIIAKLNHLYWSNVLTDQPRWYRFFRKHKIVNNLKRATIKQVIIHLSKLLKTNFRKSHYVTFWVQKMERTLPNTRLQFYDCWLFRLLDIQNHTFFHWFWMEKSVDTLVSEFRAKLLRRPSGVTYFARDPLRSYFHEPQKMKFIS